LKGGSPVTAEVALRGTSRSSELLGLSPREMVKKAKEDLAGFRMSSRIWLLNSSQGEVSGLYRWTIEGCEVLATVQRYNPN